MPQDSPILALPYLQPSQAQKHVTHNEALRVLDVLVQLVVADFDTLSPPGSPALGEVHALGAGTTGVWAGHDSEIAAWQDGVWRFFTPRVGWRAWGLAEVEMRVWDGAAWISPTTNTENLAGVGINTTSDATNRLSVNSDAVLFNNAGTDSQLKVNKASDTDTASLLFQSGWTGHAEMGLAGDTDFTIKVSPDGASWAEALRLSAATGLASGAAVQASVTDTTAGKLLGVGAFGLGTTAAPVAADMNTTLEAGFYQADANTTLNMPAGSAGQNAFVVGKGNGGNGFQLFSDKVTTRLFYRSYKASSWGSWAQVVIAGDAIDLLTVSTLNATGAGNFGNVVTVDNTGDGTRVNFTRGGGIIAGVGVRSYNTDAFETRVPDSAGTGNVVASLWDWSGATHFCSIRPNGAQVMRVDSDGKVAIGAATPAATLHTEHSGSGDTAVLAKVPNAAFNGHIFEAQAARAASNLFDFAQFSASGGTNLEFRFSGDGNGTCDGAWTGGGADYAEYFEWADGNPAGIDRRGIAVVLAGGKIREAAAGEEPIGVISGNPSMVGDGDIDHWKGKYLRDDFGTRILEDYEVVSWIETLTDTDGTRDVPHSYAADQVPAGLSVPVDATRATQARRMLDPAYDPTAPYTPRAERAEWDTVGLMGKLRIRKGQTSGARWVKMRDVSASVEEWLVR